MVLLCDWDEGSPGGKMLSGCCVEGGNAVMGLGGRWWRLPQNLVPQCHVRSH